MAETPVHVLKTQVTQLKAQVEEVSNYLVSVPIPILSDECTYAVLSGCECHLPSCEKGCCVCLKGLLVLGLFTLCCMYCMLYGCMYSMLYGCLRGSNHSPSSCELVPVVCRGSDFTAPKRMLRWSQENRPLQQYCSLSWHNCLWNDLVHVHICTCLWPDSKDWTVHSLALLLFSPVTCIVKTQVTVISSFEGNLTGTHRIYTPETLVSLHTHVLYMYMYICACVGLNLKVETVLQDWCIVYCGSAGRVACLPCVRSLVTLSLAASTTRQQMSRCLPLLR